MYETKLRKHEREFMHPDAEDVRKLVRQELGNAVLDAFGSFMARMLFGFTAGGVAVLGTMIVAAFASPGPIEEPVRSVVISMAWFIGAGAFLTVFIFYKRNDT
jgi:hypothetical protein